jgi:Rrf2 family protein
MKMSTKGRYGLRAMIDIALHSDSAQVSIKSISERQDISENYLERIIAVLKKTGLLLSTRGAQGGYELSRASKLITVGEILRALEGDLNPVDCSLVNDDKTCHESELCVTKFVWKRISDSINDVVDQITLEDLVNEQLAIDTMMMTRKGHTHE